MRDIVAMVAGQILAAQVHTGLNPNADLAKKAVDGAELIIAEIQAREDASANAVETKEIKIPVEQKPA